MNLLTAVVLIIGGAMLAFLGATWMKKRTIYLPASSDTSQPVNYESEKRREDQARAKGSRLVWMIWLVLSIFLCGIQTLSPTLKKVSAAMAGATSTPTVTNTPTITMTPTITNTPRDTFTPRPTWTPVGWTGPVTATPGSLLDTILTPVTAVPTFTPRVITNVVVHTQIVKVEKRVNVPVTVIVPVIQVVYQTVIVTPTITPSPTPTITVTPTITETPTIGVTSYP